MKLGIVERKESLEQIHKIQNAMANSIEDTRRLEKTIKVLIKTNEDIKNNKELSAKSKERLSKALKERIDDLFLSSGANVKDLEAYYGFTRKEITEQDLNPDKIDFPICGCNKPLAYGNNSDYVYIYPCSKCEAMRKTSGVILSVKAWKEMRKKETI